MEKRSDCTISYATAQADCGTYRQLAKVMAQLGWAAVRVRDFNGRGFKEQVRGYVRDVRAVQ